jgi:hypothetical protein
LTGPATLPPDVQDSQIFQGVQLVSILKRAAQLGVASIAVLAVTACGGNPVTDAATGGGSGVLAQLASDAVGSLQRSVETTGKAESVALTMTGTSDGEPVDVRGFLAFGDSPRAELTATGPEGGEVIIRMIENTFYVSIPEAEQASMKGKKWFKMDLTALGQGSDDIAKRLDDMDPVKSVRTLLEDGEVTVVGEETINGVKTVHYTSTGPVETYLERLDAELRDSVRDEFAAGGVTEVVTDVWVDEQYQPRRIQLVMGTMSDVTIDYTDYGKPVSIDAPPADETLDFAEIMSELQDLLSEVES